MRLLQRLAVVEHMRASCTLGGACCPILRDLLARASPSVAQAMALVQVRDSLDSYGVGQVSSS